MDITDVKQLRGAPLGMVGACSGPSGVPPVAPLAPDCCPCTVPFSTERGVLHLAREGSTARFRHDGGTYGKRSKHDFTGVCVSVFARELVVIGADCTDSEVRGTCRVVVR